MPQRMDIGPRGFHKAIASASVAFTPYLDRAAVVRRIIVDAVSADDVWIVSCGGRELARFPIYSVGYQQMLGGSAANFPKSEDLFQFFKNVWDDDLIYPVPQSQTLTVASVGGATGDVVIDYTEHDPTDIMTSMMNHPEGSRVVLPIFLQPPTNVTHASGAQEDNFAGQITASWLPQFYGVTQLPAGYTATFLAFFCEGAGRNTYSGSADHKSVTDHVGLNRNGMRMFTRDATDGIPNYGPAAAGGSANTVYGSLLTPYPAFQLITNEDWQILQQPFTLRGGDQYQFLFGTTGDSTGGADYSKALFAIIADIRLASYL